MVNAKFSTKGTGTLSSASDSPTASRAETAADNVAIPSDAAVLKQLADALRTIASTSEFVGDRFPEEARRIHYAEAPERPIRGTASREDARELLEEGIYVLPLPVPPDDELH
jgi:hypothetical protein